MNLPSIFRCTGPVFLAALAIVSYGQSTDLFKILEQSTTNYPTIKASQAELNSASHDVNTSQLEYLPRVSAQHQYTYSTNNSVTGAFYPNPTLISPSGGIRSENIYQGTWGSYTSAMMEWNAFNFGKVSSQINYAHASLDSKKAAYDNEVFQHQTKVADAYILRLIAGKLLTIQRINLERALRFRQAVDAGVRSGMRPGVDSSLAHAEYTKAIMLLLESEQNVKIQHYRLSELTGLAQQELPTIDSMSFFTRFPQLYGTDTELAPSNPLLRLYQTRASVTELRSKVIRKSFLPSISLVGTVWARGSGVSPVDDSFRTDFSSGTKYQVYNYLMGVSTRWVISDFFSTHQKFKSEQYLFERDRELYNQQNLKMSWMVKEAYQRYTVALEQARLAPVQATAAKQAFDQANARYKSGLTDLPTLLQSMVTLNRAEVDLAVAYSNAWRSLLALAATQGDLSVFLNAIRQ